MAWGPVGGATNAPAWSAPIGPRRREGSDGASTCRSLGESLGGRMIREEGVAIDPVEVAFRLVGRRGVGRARLRSGGVTKAGRPPRVLDVHERRARCAHRVRRRSDGRDVCGSVEA
eukprot:scaffold60091_cov28-Tisochrysis_lutea.AAC.4